RGACDATPFDSSKHIALLFFSELFPGSTKTEWKARRHAFAARADAARLRADAQALLRTPVLARWLEPLRAALTKYILGYIFVLGRMARGASKTPAAARFLTRAPCAAPQAQQTTPKRILYERFSLLDAAYNADTRC